jgi:hypothetical protein
MAAEGNARRVHGPFPTLPWPPATLSVDYFSFFDFPDSNFEDVKKNICVRVFSSVSHL